MFEVVGILSLTPVPARANVEVYSIDEGSPRRLHRWLGIEHHPRLQWIVGHCRSVSKPVSIPVLLLHTCL